MQTSGIFHSHKEYRSLNWFRSHLLKHERKMLHRFQAFLDNIHTSTNEIWCSYRRMLVNHWHYILLTNNLFVVQHPCFVLYMIAPSITMQCWSNQFILRRFLIVFLAGVGLFFHCKATRCRLLWSVHSHLSIKKTITNSCTNIHYTNRMCTPHRNSNKMVIERFQNLQAPGAAKKQININKTVKKAHRRNQKHNIPNVCV